MASCSHNFFIFFTGSNQQSSWQHHHLPPWRTTTMLGIRRRGLLPATLTKLCLTPSRQGVGSFWKTLLLEFLVLRVQVAILSVAPRIEIKFVSNKNVNSGSRSANSWLAMPVKVGSTGKHNSNKQTQLFGSSSKPKLTKKLPLGHSQL